MKDAFERRALLLHLGDALQALAAALAANAARTTVGDLVNADARLDSYAWLAAVSPDMNAADFAKRVSASFAGWPAQLLEEQVDYAQLALAVRGSLFADDPSGWQAYIDVLKREVQWFGDALPVVSATSAQAPEPAEEEPLAADASPTADVERAEQGSEVQRESVESNGRIYPSWPWKPGM
jgi:hypothetical protein